MKAIIEKALLASSTYPAYRKMMDDLLAAGKTTGPNQSDFYLEVTRLNQARMNRLDKRPRFLPEMEHLLAHLSRPFTLLVLTEAWCGDAAQTVPLLYHMAQASEQIDLRLVLRDEHPELMDLFLVNGGRSIPRVLILDNEDKGVRGVWGPRPEPAQAMAMAYKQQSPPKEDYQAFNVRLHKWYAKDKTVTAQQELIALLQAATRDISTSYPS